MATSGMITQPGADKVRLQKFLSDAGVASRRHAEELMRAGRVLVNDELVTELPAFVDPAKDIVTVDGTRVRRRANEYFIMHKPKGVVCTNRDPAGRLRAADLLPPTRAKLNVVGRLDAESTGLLLMTNDGELAEKITHPRLEFPKVYRVEVRGQVPHEIAAQLMKGVYLSEGKTVASNVEIVSRSRERSILQITLCEGRNRQVRRMLARLDFPVKSLKRVQIGPLSLKGLPVGACRRLSSFELRALQEALQAARRRTSKAHRGGPGAGPRSRMERSRDGQPAPSRQSEARRRAGAKAPPKRANPPALPPDGGGETPRRRRVIT